MTRGLRSTGLGLVLVLLAGLIPGSTAVKAPLTRLSAVPVPIPEAMRTQVREAEAAGSDYVDVDVMTDTNEDRDQVLQTIADSGGAVVVSDKTYLRARLPVAAAESVLETIRVSAVGVNNPLQIEVAQVAPLPNAPVSSEASRLAQANFSAIELDPFRSQTGADGTDVVVAVIDSGIDPGHPALLTTADGRPKIIDWKDFTREGYVNLTQAVSWGPEYVAPDGRSFQLPDASAGSRGARFGYLDEHNVTGYINQDLDRNGQKIDRFGVLLVDAGVSGRYDTVYLDADNDGSFRDESPLMLYSLSQTYARLGPSQGRNAARRLNVAVASLDPGGSWVRFGFDGLGHGTQVAGVLAGYEPGGFQGVAPGARIMALKAIRSTGSGDWFDIKDAILYAARNGADIINLSVGGLLAGSAKVFDSGASEWLNRVAREYGVLIVLAADNNGPGLSSGATLGNPSAVLAVGAYYSPDMWLRDYGWVVPRESIWFFSGVGPRSDGSYLPSVVAPGGSSATSPMWRDATGYATAVGTSIATPHVSGVAALLMHTARERGYSSDWQSIKRCLEMGARTVPGFQSYEQGHGLVQLLPSLGHLQQIASVPAIQGQLDTGGGGLLARSYVPGSAVFALTSLDPGLARVNVFASEDWVRPALTSLALPTGVPRQLPVDLSPPQVNGVHSAFLRVTHQNQYGPSLYLPITYVQPSEFKSETDYNFSVTKSLEAARYERHFFRVRPGMSQFTVSAKVPQTASGSGGTLQVHVFRPDGRPVHSGRIGANGDGPATLFLTPDPVEGAWEVVIVALPDGRAEHSNPAYSLDARVTPGAVSGQPLRFAVPTGSVTTHSIRLTNVYGSFTGRAEALGLTREAGTPRVDWRVEQRLQSTVETFVLPEFHEELRVEISNPVPDNVDLSLYLYWLDPVKGWVLRGQSITPGTSTEVVQVRNLPSGTYKTMVTGSTDTSLQYQYRRLIGSDRLNLSLNDSTRRIERGESWSPVLTIKAPNEPGRYTGYILLRDTDQKSVLSWYPIEVSVGQPALSVVPLVPQLTAGRASSVVFEVRDSATGWLVPDAVLTVNGHRYISRKGIVTVPVIPQGTEYAMRVETNLPGFQFYQDGFTFPVKARWDFYPVGIDATQEKSSWWRKLISQLP